MGITNFKGSNNQNAFELFNSRTIYDAYAYADSFEEPRANPSFKSQARDVPYTKNFWFVENLFYGRVNKTYNPIQVNPAFLTTLSGRGPNSIRCLDFVGDAFMAFRDEFVRRSNAGNLRGNNPAFIDMNVRAGHVELDRLYNNYSLSDYGLFVNSFLDEEKRSEINSFKKFILLYSDYLKRKKSLANSPITKSSFLTSKRVSPMVSGLCLEIDSRDHGDDNIKVENFISDVDFKFYSELATKFGFLIDKNAPWRLVADIGSVEMLKFVTARNSSITTTEQVFNSYYNLTFLQDFETMRTRFLSYYNKFVDANPRTRVPYVENGEIKTKNTIRNPLTRQLFDLRYPWSYWIEFYVEIKNMETNYGYSEAEIKRISKNALSLLNSLDEEAAVSYVNRKFKGFMHLEGSLNQKSIGKNSSQKELQLSAKKVSTVLF